MLCLLLLPGLQREKRLVTMTRKDLSHNVLEVEHNDGTERWLVVKTTLQSKKVANSLQPFTDVQLFNLSPNGRKIKTKAILFLYCFL